MYHCTVRTPVRHRGFSLVELMVAMTLSLILLGGVIAIFSSSRATYETTDRLSRIQESGRFALDSLVRDLRATGFVGCKQGLGLTNTLKGATTSVLWNFDKPVEAFDGQGANTWVPAIDTDVIKNPSPLKDTDILVVRIPRPGARLVRVAKAFTSTNDPVVIDANLKSTFKAQDILLISDCNARAVFEVTAVNDDTLAHASLPADTTPGNASDDLGWAFAASNDQGGAEVIQMQTVIYYLGVRDGAPAGTPPSLWRRVGLAASEELVEGVENMQLAFGENTGGGTVTYRKADTVNWNNAVTVNIALLVRSLSEYGTDKDQGTYDLLGTTLGAKITTPNDRHMRQVFATTVSLRNATL